MKGAGSVTAEFGSWLAALRRFRSAGSRALAVLVGLATLCTVSSAWAFCQTTTCNPEVTCVEDPEECCRPNAQGCDTNGEVIRWPSTCVSYSVHEEGSPKLGIDLMTTSDIVDQAFSAWMDVQCEGGNPSIRIQDYGAVSCGAPIYNDGDGPNANVWQFSDEEWIYSPGPSRAAGQVDAAALALTLISFNFKTAEIYDADVVFNSASVDFTLDEPAGIDLLSIATHEAGHFLGLDHSPDADATMAPGYVPGSIAPRTLAVDDADGLCASYPADRPVESGSCDPRGGFARKCTGGCSHAPGPKRPSWIWLLVLGFGLVAVMGRRRAG